MISLAVLADFLPWALMVILFGVVMTLLDDAFKRAKREREENR